MPDMPCEYGRMNVEKYMIKNFLPPSPRGNGIKPIAVYFLLVTCCLLLLFPAGATEINTLYKSAMDSFYKKDYKTAISLWEQILQIDPGQKNPEKLISMARAKITDNISASAEDYNRLINSGDYQKALEKLGKILEADPTNPKWNEQKDKLEKFITGVTPSITAGGKIPYLLRKSVDGYLGYEKDERIPVLASRYAWQLEKSNNLTSKVFVFMDKEYTEIARLEVMDPAKNVVDQKLDVILGAIREGKNEYAAMEGELVAALEPDNLLALKLLGSAYYAQGKTAQARVAWEKGLKIAPNDPELNKFLPKVKK